MTVCSHKTNNTASAFVRTYPADTAAPRSYNANMARRGIPKDRKINWFLREWMAASGLQGRGAQTRMCKLTGWSKATMSQLYTGVQDYSPDVVNQAATALNCQPWELLMPPEQAMALRKFRETAREVARSDPEPDGDTPITPVRRTGTDGQ